MKKIILVGVFLTVLLAFGVSAALAFQTYLPVVSNQATPTPTVNPDPIALPNGDFEQGHEVWTETSNWRDQVIINQDEFGVPVHGGEWAALMGINYNAVEKLEQSVFVPPDHPYLSFWLWIISVDYCNYDFAYVYAGTTRIDKHDLCYDHNTNQWVQKVYDLRAFSGQNIDLIISVETDPSNQSMIYLDDFEFQTSLNP